MRTTATTIAVRGSYALRMLATVRSLIEAGVLAWRTGREHRSAIARLKSMSDAELRDIGIERESITPAVTHGHRDDIRTRLDVI